MADFKDFSITKTALLDSGTVSESDFARAETLAAQDNIAFTEAVVRLEILSEEEVTRVIADALGFPYVDLSKETVAPEFLAEIPEVVARKNQIVPFKKDAEGLHLAMADPINLEISDFIARKEGMPVKVYMATERDIENTLERYGGGLSDALKKTLELAEKAVSDGGEPPIVNIVRDILSFAYQNRASDVHIEPREDIDSVIRFRIDGVLHDVALLPQSLHNQVISRIKVLARLQTDEHQKPQDGKIEFPIEREKVDVRVSLVPIMEGEKVVMRLLSERSRRFSLANLGMDEQDLKKIHDAYEKPYGMVLATGPTGCGKTTSLYTILKILNERNVNIMTIEDPVEYDLEGVNQIQVNTKANLTFATGLRSILRQDPNIILVGEIRDKETANIAINLAMTGHLVLSTLHTNDAATAIPRFVDLGVEPFLIASTVNSILAQRLVRKIHSGCRASEEISAEDVANRVGWEATQKVFGVSKKDAKKKKITLYRGKGCEACRGTGFEGRIGMFEVLVMDDEIKKAIMKNQEAGSIAELAKSRGMRTMLEDGLEKVKIGLTTLDEVLGATKA
ncbi:MAG: General secretory pathway protein E [Candidatus Moranbacteria bacterium GW2011_GWA2_39_41]|nr:MAG: General secretory pathway protein E [Candidatus Moranbacteria bacterium GW2011_GWA2_39_41]